MVKAWKRQKIGQFKEGLMDQWALSGDKFYIELIYANDSQPSPLSFEDIQVEDGATCIVKVHANETHSLEELVQDLLNREGEYALHLLKDLQRRAEPLWPHDPAAAAFWETTLVCADFIESCITGHSGVGNAQSDNADERTLAQDAQATAAATLWYLCRSERQHTHIQSTIVGDWVSHSIPDVPAMLQLG